MNKKYIILLAFLASSISLEGCDNSSEFAGYYAQRKDTCLKSKTEGIEVEYDGEKDSCICQFGDMKLECLNGTVCDADIKGCRKCTSKDNYCKSGVKYTCEHGDWEQTECPSGECLDGIECTRDYAKCKDDITLEEYQNDELIRSVDCQIDDTHKGKCENGQCVCYYSDTCGSEASFTGQLITCSTSGIPKPTNCSDGMTCPVGQTACVPIDSSVKCIENSAICTGNNEKQKCINGQYVDDPSVICEKGCTTLQGKVECRECTEDEINCVDDTHYSECTDIGKWSEETEQCSDGKVCDSELGQCVTPTTCTCEIQEDGYGLVICTNPEQKIECKEPLASCNSDNTSCGECVNGKMRCSDDATSIEICNKGEWVTNTPCTNDETCNSETLKCEQSIANCLSTYVCQNDTLIICKDDIKSEGGTCKCDALKNDDLTKAKTDSEAKEICEKTFTATCTSWKCIEDSDDKAVLTCTSGISQKQECQTIKGMAVSCNSDNTGCGECVNGTYHCHDTSNIAVCDNGTWITSKLISCGNDHCTSNTPVNASNEEDAKHLLCPDSTNVCTCENKEGGYGLMICTNPEQKTECKEPLASCNSDNTGCGECVNGTYLCHDTSNIAVCDNGTWVTSKLISCGNDHCTSNTPVNASNEEDAKHLLCPDSTNVCTCENNEGGYGLVKCTNPEQKIECKESLASCNSDNTGCGECLNDSYRCLNEESKLTPQICSKGAWQETGIDVYTCEPNGDQSTLSKCADFSSLSEFITISQSCDHLFSNSDVDFSCNINHSFAIVHQNNSIVFLSCKNSTSTSADKNKHICYKGNKPSDCI